MIRLVNIIIKDRKSIGNKKDSYSRNPDKYFANNYEEFHQHNLDAQRDYDDYIQGRNQYAEDYNEEPQKVEKKSKGLSRFNPFSSNKDEKEDAFVDISDAEFDTTINQAMHDMDDNIKFQPSNNRFRDNHNQSYGSRGYEREYDRGHGRSYDMNYDGYDDRYYDDFSLRQNDNSQRFHDSKPLRDNYNNPNHHYDNRHDSYNQRDYRQNENYNENYRRSNSRNQNYGSNSQHYDANHTRSYSGDGEIDYKYMSPRESRKRSGRNASHYDDYNHYREESDVESGNDKKNKTSDDLFEKHSRKFRR